MTTMNPPQVEGRNFGSTYRTNSPITAYVLQIAAITVVLTGLPACQRTGQQPPPQTAMPRPSATIDDSAGAVPPITNATEAPPQAITFNVSSANQAGGQTAAIINGKGVVCGLRCLVRRPWRANRPNFS